MLCGFYLNFLKFKKKKTMEKLKEFKDWIPEMSYNATLLKNILIIILSKQVCFLFYYYLSCEAREVHSSEVKRVVQPAHRESIVVNGGEHCPDPPFRIDTYIPMLLGVLVTNRTQLNSSPRLSFPPNSHLAQGHAPLWGQPLSQGWSM